MTIQEEALAELKRRGIEISDPNAELDMQTNLVRQAVSPVLTPQEMENQSRSNIFGYGQKKPTVFTVPNKITEDYKAKAMEELSKRGWDPNSINFATQIQKESQPTAMDYMKPRIGQTAASIPGGMAGAAFLPAVLGQIPPFTLVPEELLTIPASAYIGAALSGAGGKAAQVGIEEKRMPTAEELFGAAKEEGGSELLGRYAQMGAKRAIGPLIKQPKPGVKDIQKGFKAAGGYLSPAQADKRLHLNVLESLAKGGYGADEAFREFAENQMKSAVKYADNVVDDIAKAATRETSEKMGYKIRDLLTSEYAREGAIDKHFSPLYDEIFKRNPKASFPTNYIKQEALNILREDAKAGGQLLSDGGRKWANNLVKKLPDNMDFQSFKKMRTAWMNDAKSFSLQMDKSEQGLKRVIGAATETLYNPQLIDKAQRNVSGKFIPGIKNISADDLKAYQNLNATYRETMKRFQSTMPEKMIKYLNNNPTAVLKEAFPAKQPIAIQEFHDVLTQPVKGKISAEGEVAWDQLRKAWLADAIERSTKDGILNRNTFETIISRQGDDALKAMYPKELAQVKSISQLLDILRPESAGTSLVTRSAQVQSAFRIGATIAQLGGGGFLAYKGAQNGDYILAGIGGVIVVGPAAYARLALSKPGSALLKAGLPLKMGSTELGAVAARMVKTLKAEDDEQAMKVYMERKKKAQEEQLRQSRKNIFGGPGSMYGNGG